MEITVKGEPKEIAALVSLLQEQGEACTVTEMIGSEPIVKLYGNAEPLQKVVQKIVSEDVQRIVDNAFDKYFDDSFVDEDTME
jgi:hypothetical protein